MKKIKMKEKIQMIINVIFFKEIFVIIRYYSVNYNMDDLKY